MKHIGDYLDLDEEKTYACSDGSVTTTINVDNLVEAVRQDTLMKVGGWLEKRYWSERDTMLTFNDIEDLKYGEIPSE